MLGGVFKGLYRGHGIYWHGRHGFGDETNAYCRTIAEYRARIDAKVTADDEARPEHLKHWDTLSHEERATWRKLCQTTELSASELAYTNRHKVEDEDSRCQCAECDQEAVGYDEGTPLCAAHYRGKPAFWEKS